MLDTYLGLYCQGQTQLSIVSMRVTNMIVTGTEVLAVYLIQNSTEKYNNML